ncbi:MAG: response regulator [Planctomycetaceae bacterium]
MVEVTPSTGRSILDEVRSTIASLNALRSKNELHLPEPPAVEVPGAATLDFAKPDAATPVVADRPTGSEIPSFPIVDERAVSTVEHGLHDDRVVEAERLSADVVLPDLSADPKSVVQQHLRTEAVSLRHVNKDARIMIVDDEPLNIMTFRQHLKGDGYHNFITTDNPRQALVMIREQHPDVLLLDIHMPEISGLDIVRVMALDPATQHIPVLILTAATDPRVRRQALDLGASDFLAKPVDPDELLPRVRNAIILKQHYDMVANEAARLEQQVERRTRQLEATRQQLILSLARAAEHRDNDTGNHVIRVGRYAALIASALNYPENKLSMLEQAAQLHDVGKIGIPDSILFKPGKLDLDQYELMKRHCAIGKQIIEPISEKDWEVLKTHTRRGESLLHVRSSPLLMLAARIAQTHHEKWDGSGYPLGLAGEDIPLEGRIVAVADVFDALSSARPYKRPFSREKCFEILEEGRGRHFDPQVLDAFFRKSRDIIETQLMLMDEEESFVGPDYV